MITGIVYILTSVTLSLLLAFVRKKNQAEPCADDASVFRYPSAIFNVFLFPVSLLIGLFMFVRVKPEDGNAAYIFISIFVFVFMSLQVLCYRYFKEFELIVGDNSIGISSIFGSRIISFHGIGVVEYVEGGKGRHILVLKDIHGKKIIDVSESMRNFEVLVTKVKEKACKAGAEYKCRDRWGKWSKEG